MAFSTTSVNSYFPLTQNYLSTNSLNSIANRYKGWSSITNASKSMSSQFFNESLFTQLGNVKAASGELRAKSSSLAALNSYSTSVGKAADYSNSDVLNASVGSGAQVSKYTKTNVAVSQIAAGQTNKGAALEDSANDFGNSFNLSITDGSGKTTEFNVNLSASDNNKSAMRAMADKINAADIGIKASLVEDKSSKTSYLTLDSTKTGKQDGAFTVTGSGAASLTAVSSASADAKYSVNGGAEISSKTNDVQIISGVSATLKKVGATEITYKADSKSAVNMVSDFVNAFNEFKDSTKDIPVLQSQMKSLTNAYGRSLGYSGIGVDSDGKLTVNADKVASAVEDGSLSRNFQGVHSFGTRLDQMARGASGAAYSSVYKSSAADLLSSLSNSNSYMSQMFNSALPYSGLIFNALI